MTTTATAAPEGKVRGIRVGWVPIAYCWLLVLGPLLAPLLGAAVYFSTEETVDEFGVALVDYSSALLTTVITAGVVTIATLIFLPLCYISARRLQRGTRGRGRLMGLPVAHAVGILLNLLQVGLIALLFTTELPALMADPQSLPGPFPARTSSASSPFGWCSVFRCSPTWSSACCSGAVGF